MQLGCRKGQWQSSAFWLSPLQSLSFISALTHSHFFPLTSLSTSLSSAFLSIFNISLSLPPLSLKPDIATATCEHTCTRAHTQKACCLATNKWDRCRPIREASERAVDRERKPIDRRVPLHINLKQRGFNPSLTFGSPFDQKEMFHSDWYVLTNASSSNYLYILDIKLDIVYYIDIWTRAAMIRRHNPRRGL